MEGFIGDNDWWGNVRFDIYYLAMKSFEVWFEIYGKKLKTTIKADSMADAQMKIRNSIIFHKTTLCESDKTVDALKNIFGMT